MTATNSMPRIGIVTPSFNHGRFLTEAILSVSSQDFASKEHLVVDGGSEDESVEVLRRHEHLLAYWSSEQDNGPADAIHKGWERSRGEILAYLNADDLYLPGALSAVDEAFRSHPDAVALCGSQLFIDPEGRVLSVKRVTETSYQSLLEMRFIPQPAVFLRREALEQAGGIDVSQSLIFDWELFLRVFRLGSVMVIPRVLAATRWHEDTITQKRLPQVGAELVRTVTLHTRSWPGIFDRSRARHLRAKVNRLAALYHVQANQTLASVPFLLRSIVNSKGAGEILGTLRVWAAEIREPRNPSRRYLGKAPGVHWSDWRDEPPTRS